MSLSGQQPDYDIDSWVGDGFDGKARPFFSAIALQTSMGGLPFLESGDRWAVGLLLSGGTPFGRGRPGVIPALYGHYGIGSNLTLNGLTSGFVSDRDVIILWRYGLNYRLTRGEEGSWRWMIRILMGSLQGTDDFFLKTVDAGLARGINYRGLEGWIGLAMNGYEAGIHIRDSDPEMNLNKRLKGQINSIFLGVRRSLASGVGASVEASFSPMAVGLALGIHRIIE